MRVRLVIAGILIVVLFVISSGRVSMFGCSESGPPELTSDQIVSYWAGASGLVDPQAGVEELLIERVETRQDEERVLEAVVDSFTRATETDWDYDAPAEVLVVLRTEDGREVSLSFSPTQDEEPRHVVGQVLEPDGESRAFRLMSDDLDTAALGLVALVESVKAAAAE